MLPDDKIPGSAADWLARARNDVAMAKAPLPEGAIYESLCFHAQQAAEKAIKALHKWHGLAFEFTHNIGHLLHRLERHGLQVPEEIWEASDLTRFAVETRYPIPAELVTEEEYREAVKLAERVLQWAASIIESPRQ